MDLEGHTAEVDILRGWQWGRRADDLEGGQAGDLGPLWPRQPAEND